MTKETKGLVPGLLAAHLRNLKLAPASGMGCATLVREFWHGDRRVQLQVKLIDADPRRDEYLNPAGLTGAAPAEMAEALSMMARGEDCE